MVAARSREIGLRMAVGAERKDVAMLVLNRAATLQLVGLCLGSAVALAASCSMKASDWWRPLLFGVSWFEPQTYFKILLVLGVVSTAACLLPTWRAMRIDPMRVLREE
jgi:ABC-type antimicrobial peptide transport system permease subunit